MRYTLLLLLAAILAVPASAQCTGTAGTDFQQVTLGEVNALPQAQIDALNAGGASLTDEQVETNLASPLFGETIEFTAVIMTSPVLSGLGSPNDGGAPNRYHVFVRDTDFDTNGAAGQGGQIVDGSGAGTITNFFVGDEVTVCAEVTSFGNITQLDPISIVTTGSRDATDPILDPVVITSDVIHDTFDVGGETLSQLDWDIYGDYVNQYVRFENIELVQGIPAGANGRVNMLFSSTGEMSTIRSYDTSVCYRNDRNIAGYYPSGNVPACVEDDFVPPPTGIVNVQGFLSLPGFDTFNSAVPSGDAVFSVSPFTPDDFVIAVSPPIVVLGDETVATAAEGVAISTTITPGTTGNTIASAVADYTTSSGGSGQVTLTNTSGDLYDGQITGLTAGDFVTYTVTATDNQGAAAVSSEVTRRVLDGAVTSIFDVQVTESGGPGASGITSSDPIAFDLDAVVMSAGSFGGRFQATIQDDATLSPFSGVLVDFGSTDPGLSVGDQITITEARVSEFRDVTQLVDVVYTTTGSGAAYDDKEVSTLIFNGADGADTAEQHEGMMLRFSDVSITSTNPDAPNGPFGEFAFSSDGTEDNDLRADDLSDDIAEDFASTLTVGQDLDYIRGFMSFSFGNYKLIPPMESDVDIAGVAVGNGPGESALEIVGTYPNPSAGAVRVRFELASAGEASLRVYDLTGREVAVVAEGTFSADVHDATADLDGLASGVYLVRLSAGGDVATARIAIVR